MSRASASRACLLVAALLVTPKIASAQLLAPWPFLPIEFTLGATLEERYTDNFFLGARKKVDDFRTTLSPGFTLGLTTGRNRSDLRYTLSVANSTADTDNPRLFNSLDGTDRFAVSERVSLVVREVLAESDDPGVTDVRGIQEGRSTATNNSATATLTYTGDLHSGSLFYSNSTIRREIEALSTSATGTATATTGSTEFKSDSDTFGANGRLALGARTSLEPGASYTIARFSTKRGPTSTTAAPSSESGFTGYEGTLGLTRELPAETKVGLRGSYTLRQPDEGKDFTIMRGLLTVARPLTPTIDVAAEAGYEHVSGAVELSGPSGTVTVTYHGAVFSVVLAGGQEVRETFQDSINAGLVQTRDARASLTYAPTDRVRVVTTGAIANTKFLQGDVAAGQATVAQSGASSSSTIQESTLYSFDIALVVKLTRIFSGAIGYSYRKRDINRQAPGTTTTSSSASGGGGFEANTFTVSLTGSYE